MPWSWHTPGVVGGSDDLRAEEAPAERILRPRSLARLLVGIAVGVGLPILATSLVVGKLLDQFPSLIYVMCVVAAALIGRLIAGTVAVLTSSVLLSYYVIEPTGSLSLIGKHDAVDFGIFVGVGLVMAALLARTDQSRVASKQANRRMEIANHRLALVADASRTLTASFDLNANLQAVCAAIVDNGAFGHAVALSIRDGKAGYLAGAHAPEPRRRRWRRSGPTWSSPSAPAATAFDTTPAVLNSRQIHVLEPATGRQPRAFGPLSYRSGLTVPLLIGNETVGALLLLDTAKARVYNDYDLIFAKEMGERIARAMDNARRYDHQAHIAGTLQRSLLPRTLPVIPGVRVHAHYQAGAGTEVGGDFYDVFAIDEDTWMLVVGDVCGKGPEAAVVMTITRATLRALALHEHSPKRLLTLLNEALLAQGGDQRFVTVCAATLRLQSGVAVLNLALGGHPPPIVRRRDGSIAAATTAYGTLLGGFTDVHLSETNLELFEGESVVFYTDGIEAHEIAAQDRALQLLQPLGAASAHQIADVFAAAVLASPDGKTDDLVVLALEIVGVPTAPGRRA